MKNVAYEPTGHLRNARKSPCKRHTSQPRIGVSHPPSTSASSTGRIAENLVIWYLKNRGWSILAHNYAAKCGEIDIIAARFGHDIPNIQTVAFIEVKSKTSDTGLSPACNVTKQKQNRILSTVKQYISHHAREKFVCRCDVASVILAYGRAPRIRYIPNAFCAREEFGWQTR